MTVSDPKRPGVVYKLVPGIDDLRATGLGTVEILKRGRKNISDRWETLDVHYTVARQFPRVWFRVNRRNYSRSVASLVLAAFYGPCPDGYEWWAKNGNIRDTRPENLIWAPLECTRLWYRLEYRQTGCWYWPRMADRVHAEMVWNGRRRGAHQVAYELAIGPIPDGLWVLHRCDNPPCCNPEHLFLGTAQDNTDDMMAKGRCSKGPPLETVSRGEARWNAKLTAADVRTIRERYAKGGVSLRILGIEYGVGKGHMGKIINRECCSHVQ